MEILTQVVVTKVSSTYISIWAAASDGCANPILNIPELFPILTEKIYTYTWYSRYIPDHSTERSNGVAVAIVCTSRTHDGGNALPFNRETAEAKYLGLFQFIDLTKDFFYSYTYDLTNSLQHNMTAATSKTFPPPPFKVCGCRVDQGVGYPQRAVWTSGSPPHTAKLIFAFFMLHPALPPGHVCVELPPDPRA